jgi:hypothetical protein
MNSAWISMMTNCRLKLFMVSDIFCRLPIAREEYRDLTMLHMEAWRSRRRAIDVAILHDLLHLELLFLPAFALLPQQLER